MLYALVVADELDETVVGHGDDEELVGEDEGDGRDANEVQ